MSSGADLAAAAHLVIFVLFFGGLALWTLLEERRSGRRRERIIRGEIAVALPELARSNARLQPAIQRRWFSPGGVPCVVEQRANPLNARLIRARATAVLPVPLVLEAVSRDAAGDPVENDARHRRTFPSFRTVSRDSSGVSRRDLARVAETLEQFRHEVAVPVSVSLGANGIAIQMSAPPRGRRGDALVRTLLGLVSIFDRQVPDGAIRVLETRISLKRGQCPVCRQRAGSEPVHCTRCGTPHHEDCWAYLGFCGLYGCGERRSA